MWWGIIITGRDTSQRALYIYYYCIEPAEVFVPELTGCVNNFIFSILKSHAKVSTEGIIREYARVRARRNDDI